nr:2 glutaredoxin 5-like protein 2 [Halisarca dujardinii]
MGGSSSKAEARSVIKQSPQEFVEASVVLDKVVVFIKPSCPYCARVKKLFGDLGARIFVVDIDKRPDMAGIQEYLQEKTGARTVPRVFIDGECVGGFDETLKMHELGKLQPKLVQIGIVRQ